MEKVNFIRWWRYASVWKVIGLGIGAVVLSLICALFIPGAWCLCGILPICGVCGYFIRKFGMDALADIIIKEIE